MSHCYMDLKNYCFSFEGYTDTFYIYRYKEITNGIENPIFKQDLSAIQDLKGLAQDMQRAIDHDFIKSRFNERPSFVEIYTFVKSVFGLELYEEIEDF